MSSNCTISIVDESRSNNGGYASGLRQQEPVDKGGERAVPGSRPVPHAARRLQQKTDQGLRGWLVETHRKRWYSKLSS